MKFEPPLPRQRKTETTPLEEPLALFNSQNMVSTRYAVVIRPVLVAIGLLLCHCTEEKPSFYKDPMLDYDVWRLPLIEPYQLITAYCCKEWNFQAAGFVGFSADSISVTSRYILFYGYPGEYGFLDMQRKQIVRFRIYQQFADSVAARGIGKKLYYTETVYTNWRETGQLPWAPEILATRQSK